MVLKNLSLLDFKNIREASLEFSPRINCLLGNNGMGKSNLLEAIHVLCMARPFSAVPEQMLIRHDASTALIKGEFISGSDVDSVVSCGLVRGKGKSFKTNGKEYDRISHHIGKYPLVVIAPSDINIVTGPAEMRRRLMDIVISQSDSTYLNAVIRYNKALESRNKMLKAGLQDPVLFESVEATMQTSADEIFIHRRDWIANINPILSRHYSMIAGEGETVSVAYESSLSSATLHDILETNRGKDRALGFTSAGVHRDNMATLINGYPLRTVGSQGQLKTFTIALRLAIFDFIGRNKNTIPILLLDDIFDKLDAERVENIMKIVSDINAFGQIFITDTNRKHLDEIVAAMGGDHFLFEVTNGNFRRCNAPNRN